MRRFPLVLTVGLLSVLTCGAGCGKGYPKKMAGTTAVSEVTGKAGPSPREAEEAPALAFPAQPVGKQGKAGRAPVARKIIYTAELQVVVEDFAAARKALEKLVKDSRGGYVAQSEVTGSPGQPRSGHWKARIPVARFDKFRAAVAALGEAKRDTISTEDKTAEFYDLQARIKNKQQAERRLLDILQKATGKLEDVLKVEEVLSRVREEIERMQGQAELIANLAAMTTVDVTLYERESYVPPEGPGFGTSVSRTFNQSVNALVALGRAVALVGVALSPWLPFIVPVAVALWLVLRRRRREARRIPVVTPAPPRPPAG
jgi:hypothetical protein